MFVVVVQHGAEEHIVALAVGYVVRAAEREGHPVHGAATRLQEGDSGVERRRDELVHILEAGFLSLLVKELEALENHVHGLDAEQFAGHGLAVRGKEGFRSVHEGVNGGAGEGLIGQSTEQVGN